jgi:hypothetical protein
LCVYMYVCVSVCACVCARMCVCVVMVLQNINDIRVFVLSFYIMICVS